MGKRVEKPKEPISMSKNSRVPVLPISEICLAGPVNCNSAGMQQYREGSRLTGASAGCVRYYATRYNFSVRDSLLTRRQLRCLVGHFTFVL